MAGPLVSFVIRTHEGRGALLDRAMRSARAQTWPDVEVIVVEDGSGGCGDVPAAGGGVAPVTRFAISRAGRAAAGNAGVTRSRGDLVGFLDDDDELLPDHAALLVAALAAHPAAPAAYAGCIEVRAAVAATAPLRLVDAGETAAPAQPFELGRLWRGNFLPIQSVLFRRAAWNRAGPLDTRLEALEDWDLWLRLAMGGDFVAVDAITSRYRVPAETDRARARRQAHDRCIWAVRAKQAALAADLGPDRRFAGLDAILSGAFDRRAARRARLGAVPVLGPALRRGARLFRTAARRDRPGNTP